AYAYATAAAADAYSYAYIAVTAAATDDAAAYATVTTYAVANVDIWPIVRRDCWEISNTGALHNAELWHDQPNPLADRWQQIKRLLHDDPLDWSFWVKWVEAALDGAPLNWDMLRKIALISPEDWRQNTRHMNGIIASIEDEFRDVLADPIRLDTQTQTTPAVEHLFQQRILTEMVADGLAGQIYDAIERFTADTGQNELPEAFQALESLPPVLESIALLARRSQENGGLLQEMREEIGKLRMLVSELEYDLRLAKENTIKHALTKSFIDQAGKSLGDWKMYGALIGAVTFFVASPAQAETLNGISSCIKSIFAR
ncbi:MAG: hypothetical protein JKY31_01155, partial [Rhodobacteraceae bacterium]|nr:hypothetical protein [Paracoccaceae bacterium]